MLAALRDDFAVRLIREHLSGGTGDWLQRYGPVRTGHATYAAPVTSAAAMQAMAAVADGTTDCAPTAANGTRSTNGDDERSNVNKHRQVPSNIASTGVEAALRDLLLDESLLSRLKQVCIRI